MEEHSSELKGFLALAKSARGVAMTSLVTQVLDHPAVNVFGELLDMPNVKELASAPATAPSLELLKVFAYGTWKDYRARQSELPPLSDKQTVKLKKLTVVSLATQSKMLSYEVLMRELELPSVRELEDLLIECTYQGLVTGRFDPQAGHLDVFSCAGRDVHPDELPALTSTLLEWHANATGVMAQVSAQLGAFKQQVDESRTAQAALDQKVEAVKAQLRASAEAGDGSAGGFGGGGGLGDYGGDFDEGEKMRKGGGRLKARHGAPGGKQAARM